MLLQLPFIKMQENLYKNVNENMFSFTLLCKFSYTCNFAIFVQIFMKFSPKCRIGNDIHHFGKLLLIFELVCPKSGLGKSLVIIMFQNIF